MERKFDNRMEQLITIIGEMYPQDLQAFLDIHNVKNVNEFITFLYNLTERDVKEVINEIEFNKQKERLVTISNRSVYHKYAEVTIPIPKHIKQEDVAEWLFKNENLYTDDLDQRMSEARYEFGFGLDYDANNYHKSNFNERESESETRYDIEGEKYGGHL